MINGRWFLTAAPPAHSLCQLRNGQSINYDAVGNPVEYLGDTLTWTMGRQLATFGDISYMYNEDGIRTSKTSNGVTTKFYLDGTNIIEQTDGTTTLHFFYDSVGEIVGFKYNGNNYIYVKNSMGDIVGIADDTGNLIASYTYDAWGKVTSVTGSNVTIGELNPFRYRGYYYDSDIQMYYLQSRYYDPDIGRFINSDDVSYIGGTISEISYNPFAYCGNNPVNNLDKKGYKKYSSKVEKALKIISNYSISILSFSSYYGVDPLAVAGAIFVEQAFNYNLRDVLTDRLLAKMLDTSLGLGQIKLSNAKMLEEECIIYPLITKVDNKTWYVPGYGKYKGSYTNAIIKRLYVKEQNINYVAAFLFYLQEMWYKSYPSIVNDTVMLVSLYNYSRTPNGQRYTNEFGKKFEQYKTDIEEYLYGSASLLIYMSFYSIIQRVFR